MCCKYQKEQCVLVANVVSFMLFSDGVDMADQRFNEFADNVAKSYRRPFAGRGSGNLPLAQIHLSLLPEIPGDERTNCQHPEALEGTGGRTPKVLRST